MIKKQIDLCIPIYLDQQIVFDLLAILEDGFSQVNTVNTSTTGTKSNESKLCGSLSSVVLHLIDFSVDGNRSKKTTTEDSTNSSMEKIHTPSSMFSLLRLMLYDRKFVQTVKSLENLATLNSGDFVEFKANLRNNPLIDNLDRLKELSTYARIFSNENNNQSNKQSGKNASNNHLGKQNKEPFLFEKISGLLDDQKKSNSSEIVGSIVEEPKISVDVSSKTDCFICNDTYLVMNGEFYVFGKVTQVLANKNEKINLLQKTVFRSIGEAALEKYLDIVNKMSNTDVNIPKVTTRIEAPAIQVVPIAIFI